MKEFLKRPSVWGTILSIAVIAITAFAYFYPDAQQGRTLLQHDIQQGAAIGQVNRQSRIMQKHDERGVAKNEITEATAEPTEVKTEDEDHDKI